MQQLAFPVTYVSTAYGPKWKYERFSYHYEQFLGLGHRLQNKEPVKHEERCLCNSQTDEKKGKSDQKSQSAPTRWVLAEPLRPAAKKRVEDGTNIKKLIEKYINFPGNTESAKNARS